MVADHEDHGNTPAAWTTATLVTIAFIIASVAVWTMNWPLFWIGGVGMLVVAAIVGKVMAMMGMGKQTQSAEH